MKHTCSKYILGMKYSVSMKQVYFIFFYISFIIGSYGKEYTAYKNLNEQFPNLCFETLMGIFRDCG